VKCESNIKTKDAREAEEWEETRTNPSSESIVLKPGRAQRVDPGPGRPEAGTGPGWRKNRGRKNPVWLSWPGDPVDPARPGCKPVDFFIFYFLLKWRRFDFKKQELTRPKPGNPIKTRNPGRILKLWVKWTGEGYVFFFWVMSVLLSLARGIKDARQAQAFFQSVGQNHVVHRPRFSLCYYYFYSKNFMIYIYVLSALALLIGFL
jgi:hypothetical protein